MTPTRAQITAAHVLIAALLALAAYATAPNPTAPAASDRGEAFFPDFTDPNAAASLEVVEFDEQALAPRPFVVVNRDGKWVIPSHYDYPADAGDRLPAIAAAVIALRKGDIASENVADQERCGVIDPLDAAAPALTGRGTRVTVKGRNEQVLADIIYGAPIEGRPSFRYVRRPDDRRIYVAEVRELNLSTRLHEWIDRDLLHVDRSDIDRIMIRNYSVRTGIENVELREIIGLRATGRDRWAFEGPGSSDPIAAFPMNLLVTTLDDLALADVVPKPPGLAAMLTGTAAVERLPQPEIDDLTQKGFFITTQGILGSDGDVVVRTRSGVFFTLRFGRLAPPSVQPAAAGGAAAGPLRYLFITATFDPPAQDGSVSAAVQNQLALLRTRFAPWHFLISDEDVRKIRLPRQRLLASR